MILLHPAQQTTDQAAQVATAALQAPLNTLIAILAILAILVSIVVVVSVVYAVYRFAPLLIKQVQQLIDNNSKLTQIAQQNADQIKSTETVLAGIQPELVKQTNAIETQTVEIRTQSLDLRNYQVLVSDGLSNHSAQIEANTTAIKQFETTISSLPDQIRAIIDDKLQCANLENQIRALRAEIVQFMVNERAAKKTGTQPVVPLTTAPNGGETT